MKKITVLFVSFALIIAVLLGAVACSASSQSSSPTAPATTTQTAPGATVEVIIKDLAFLPSTITVAAGTTVTWINQDSVLHTATSVTGVFDSGTMSKNDSFSFTFSEKGNFKYFCTFHPFMTGTVIVN
ncbi:MAG: hypothetical protein A2Z15_00685 [Chloroflexi bacterium RBG_16_50_11]|nr:MAG: hypothetical protein A2Z15_00685 [Chloroflexi bacterium RBG_16_50_11]